MSMYKVINPYDNSVFGEFDYTTKAQMDASISKLKLGLKEQKKLTAHERALKLRSLATIMEKNAKELATIITKEMGKTISDSLVEVTRAINTINVSADTAKMIHGEVGFSDAYPPLRDKMGIIVREPLGIVLAITPFNFPINLSLHKIGPAFIAGNTIYFKPGPQNYYSAKMLVEMMYQAGFSENLIQLGVPDIPELSSLIASDDIQCVSFTGGIHTAKAIAKNAGMKKLLMELGGNDPLIVMDDADINLAVSTAVNQRFGTAGQRCTSPKRLFVHAKVFEEFKTKLVAEASKLVVGNPMDEKTFVGPVVNARAADDIMRRIDLAIKQGAKLLLGNKREGNIIYPTILEDIKPTMELVCDETFGPVVPLFKFSNIEEIIPIINGTPFGLQSGVFTQNLSVIKKLFKELEVGALAVNDGPGFRAEHFPFGGVKQSGLGREGVKYAAEEMSYLKTLIL